MKRGRIIILLPIVLFAAACAPAAPIPETGATSTPPGAALPADEEIIDTPQVPETLLGTPGAALEPLPAEEIPTALPTIPADIGSGETDVVANPTQVRNLLSFEVLNNDAELIGQVAELLLEPNDSRIAYVVMSPVGNLDLQGEYILIPWDAFNRVNPDDEVYDLLDQGFYLDINQDELISAPAINRAQLDTPETLITGDLLAFWEPFVETEELPPVDPPVSDLPVIEASELLNATIRPHSGGEILGTVFQAIADPESGRITYIVVDPGEAAGMEAQVVPVPFGEFTITSGDGADGILLQINQDLFVNAPTFDRDNLPDPLLEGWDLDVIEYWGAEEL